MKVLYPILLLLLISCSDNKIYKRKLNNGEINVAWYRYSYVTSGSPNYIEVKMGDKEELIFEYGWGLQDIELHNDTITIVHFKFNRTPKVKKDSVFGYKIIYRETNADEIYEKINGNN